MEKLKGIFVVVENITKYLKLVDCISAGLQAFNNKAKEVGLYAETVDNTK